MAPRQKTAAKKAPAQTGDALVDKIVDETIRRHLGDAQEKESHRLGPRRRIAKRFLSAIEKELGHRGNGLRMKAEKIAELCERLAKEACKSVGLEPQGKKEDE